VCSFAGVFCGGLLPSSLINGFCLSPVRHPRSVPLLHRFFPSPSLSMGPQFFHFAFSTALPPSVIPKPRLIFLATCSRFGLVDLFQYHFPQSFFGPVPLRVPCPPHLSSGLPPSPLFIIFFWRGSVPVSRLPYWVHRPPARSICLCVVRSSFLNIAVDTKVPRPFAFSPSPLRLRWCSLIFPTVLFTPFLALPLSPRPFTTFAPHEPSPSSPPFFFVSFFRPSPFFFWKTELSAVSNRCSFCSCRSAD